MFEYEFAKDDITTLKKSSYDSSNDKYLSEKVFPVFKIDEYNEKRYQKERKQKCCICGADACFEKNGKLYIIEFKNCYINKQYSFEVLEKMYDSSIVLMDKLNLTLAEFRDRAVFILVYSFDLNTDNEALPIGLKFKKRGWLQFETSVKSKGSAKVKDYDKISFGLTRLEGYLYNHIYAIPSNYFDKYLEEENLI